jgi:hypothetical protein
MEYGYTYNPVINEQNTPGIWQSDFANFPVTFQKGRILIASDTGAIYLDLVSSRIILVSSHSNLFFSNGLVKTDLPNNIGYVNMGGEFEQDTVINGLGVYNFDLTNINNTTLSGIGNFTINCLEFYINSVNGIYQCGIQNIGRSVNTHQADVDGNMIVSPLVKFTPLTGTTVNLVTYKYNVVAPAAAILALTLNFPTSPNDDDVLEIKFTKAVSTITFIGGSVAAPITVAVIGTYLKFVANGGVWY